MVVSVVLTVAPQASASRATSHLLPEEQALLDHLDSAYGMDLAARLSSLPYPHAGEVVSGSPEDEATAAYIGAEMRSLGLADVTIDSFPLVSWTYKSASLEILSPLVSGPAIETRSMANSPSTPGGGPLEGDLVYVGMGRNVDYDAIAGGIAGKIVLIDRSVVMWYSTPAVREAGYRGAIGALLRNPWRDPAALNVDTAHNSIPTLSITGNDADYLIGLLKDGPVKLRFSVDNRIDEGAYGHAVYGYIWGSEYPDEYIVLEGHFDHWWNGANDDNGGVGATLAIAKAIKDAGIAPKRTFVFMALSGHETGTGGSRESFWDWGLGGYYFMNTVHPEWRKKVVWSSVSDGGGVKAQWMFVETTPELKGLLKQVAYDVGVQNLITPYIFTPVSSFDSWGFYMAGVPTSSVYYGALSALVEEYYYHTDLEGMGLLDAEHLGMDAAFRGVAGLRISQSDVLPYKLSDTSNEVRKTVSKLVDKVPDADVSTLLNTLDSFDGEVGRVQAYAKALKNPVPSLVRAINAKLIEAVNTVNPLLWDQDIGLWNPYPGWCSVTKFETFTNDMSLLRTAIADLEKGDLRGAITSLGGIVTMSWGQYVSYPVYLDTVWLFNGTPYLNWATGHLPWLTDVHQDYSALRSGTFDPAGVIASLSAKLSVLYEKLGITAGDVGVAFEVGTTILGTI